MAREQYHAAVRDFRQARRRASLTQIAARLTGRPAELLSYDQVLDVVRPKAKIDRGVQDVPLEAIAGSVGRHQEFSRDFLPLSDDTEERWAGVRMRMFEGRPIDPVELYKVGDVYFVIDGNHRVSVSRELGLDTIRARVTEIATEVPVRAGDDIDSLICRNRHAHFLAETGLDEAELGFSFSTSSAGKYRLLDERIARYQLSLQEANGAPVDYQTAARYWFENDYRPVTTAIREQGILRDFADRTETDLYVWLVRHREALQAELGWEVDPQQAAQDLAAAHSPRAGRLLTRVGDRLRDLLAPERLDAGPAPGDWRHRPRIMRSQGLFRELLVVLSDIDRSDSALRCAINVAAREAAVLHGCYVVSEEDDVDSPQATTSAASFAAAAAAAGVKAHFQPEWLRPRELVQRSRWVDLVVAEVTNPPGEGVVSKLSSRFHLLLQQCPRPILAVPPHGMDRISRALLAYDDSRKAREALYIAAYLADQWRAPLVILSVGEQSTGEAPPLASARRYLKEHGVRARYVRRPGPVGETILTTARDMHCDLIIMGGFGHRPVLQIVLGSAVERVLQESDRPVLICR